MTQDEIPSLAWDLANRLLANTNKGAIKWASTDRDYSFIYSGSEAAVVIELSGPGRPGALPSGPVRLEWGGRGLLRSH